MTRAHWKFTLAGTASVLAMLAMQPTRLEAQTRTIQDRAGEAGTRITATSNEVSMDLNRLREALSASLRNHEKAPKFDTVAEADRVRLFTRILEDVVTLGLKADADQAKLLRSFQSWTKASREAAPVFRQAEEHFHELAMHEPTGRAKALYAKAELWYGARAARCELQGKKDVPVNFKEEVARVKGMVKASEELLSFVRKDASLFEDQTGRGEELTAFLQSFTAVETVLDEWTATLVKDLRPEASKPN